MQIRGSTDAPQHSAAVQLRGHGDGIGGLPTPVQVQDRVVDDLVSGLVEVTRPQLLEHVGDGVLAQQHPAEHRLLGSGILRGLATEILVRRGILLPRGTSGPPQVIYDSHAAPHPPDRDRTHIRYAACCDSKSSPDKPRSGPRPFPRGPTLDVAVGNQVDPVSGLVDGVCIGPVRDVESLWTTCGSTASSTTFTQMNAP